MATAAIHNDIELTPSEVEGVRRSLGTATFLPPRIYADRAIFDEERKRVFGRSWLPLCHLSQLKQDGSYLARQLFGEPVVATRDKSGTVRVLSNVCRHRNAVIAQGSGACRGSRMVCPYHGWTYGLDGKLIGAPFMQETEDFSRTDVKLPEIRHEVWQGFLFVTFDDDAPALADLLATLTPKVAPFGMDRMRAVEVRRFTAPWNWKITMENFTETYHQPFIHPVTANKTTPAEISRFDDSDGPWSMFWMPHHSGEKMPTLTPAIEGLPDDYYSAFCVINVYPLLHIFTDAATPLWLDWEINDVEEHELVWYMMVPEEHISDENTDELKQGFLGFIEPILLEDVDICKAVGRGVKSSLSRPGRLSRLEKGVHQFQNWWLDAYTGERSTQVR